MIVKYLVNRAQGSYRSRIVLVSKAFACAIGVCQCCRGDFEVTACRYEQTPYVARHETVY